MLFSLSDDAANEPGNTAVFFRFEWKAMKSQKIQKEKSETSVRTSAPMAAALLSDIRDLILLSLKKGEVAV